MMMMLRHTNLVQTEGNKKCESLLLLLLLRMFVTSFIYRHNDSKITNITNVEKTTVKITTIPNNYRLSTSG